MHTRFKPVRLYRGLAVLLLSGVFIGACDSNPRTDTVPDKPMTASDSMTSSVHPMDTLGVPLDEPYDSTGLAAFRASKDDGLRSNPSPIPDSLRSSFTGLVYFPPAPEFVFRVALQRFDNPEVVKIAGTKKDDIRSMIRYGSFSFPVDGKICTLTAYKSEDGRGGLFIPFRDATNNRETYGVGRYLDLKEQPGSGPYVLDFNLAYNPYCAYNENYTCPLVPKENILPVEIRAGEKLPPMADH